MARLLFILPAQVRFVLRTTYPGQRTGICLAQRFSAATPDTIAETGRIRFSRLDEVSTMPST